ncbi:MAG: hypothetical protein KDD53_07430, partial [Bdellovibrionales bacterium]|nr:hypothetical protein [Bdellovibrionales bacterium]
MMSFRKLTYALACFALCNFAFLVSAFAGEGEPQCNGKIITVDFNDVPSGAFFTDQIPGISAFAVSPSGQIRVFNSSLPTADDLDLGTPNGIINGGPGVVPGGPGVGVGPGAGTGNSRALGNLLILQNPAYVEPNDDPAGGFMVFDFDIGVQVMDLRVVDLESNEADIVLGCADSDCTIKTFPDVAIAGLGDNSVQVVPVYDNSGFETRRLVLYLNGSGALGRIRYCAPNKPLPPVCRTIHSGNSTTQVGENYFATYRVGDRDSRFVNVDYLDLPNGAVVRPPEGDTAVPFAGSIRWVPTLADVGVLHKFSVEVMDRDRLKSRCDFETYVPEPDLTCDAGEVYGAECTGAETSVQLEGKTSCFEGSPTEYAVVDQGWCESDYSCCALEYSWSTTCPGGSFDDESILD